MSSRDSLTITDNRTGKTYEVPITDDTIRAIDLRQIKVKPDDFGMMTYDPAFSNTALCRARSPLSTATRASSAIAAIPSKNWPSAALIWKPLT